MMRKTEDYLIDKADQCMRLAKAGREMAATLEAMSNDLMAKAVELDTSRQKDAVAPERSSESVSK